MRREVAQPGYWRRHVREPVRFADGLVTLAASRPTSASRSARTRRCWRLAESAFGERSAQRCSAPRRCARAATTTSSSPRRSARCTSPASRSTGARSGRATPHRLRRSAGLCRSSASRCWFRARATAVQSPAATAATRCSACACVRHCVTSCSSSRCSPPTTLPFLRDHQVHGGSSCPPRIHRDGAGRGDHRALRRRWARRYRASSSRCAFVGHETRIVQLVVRRGRGAAAFEILSQLDGDAPDAWRLHASGRCVGTSAAERQRAARADPRALHRTSRRGVAPRAARRARPGVRPQPARRAGDHRRDGEALARIELPEPSTAGAATTVCIRRCSTPACRSIAAALPSQSTGGRAFLPMAIDRMRIMRPPRGAVWSHAVVHGTTAQTLHADVTVRDELGHVVAELLGVALRPAPQAARVDDALYEVAWQRDDGAAWLLPPASLAEQAGALLDPLADEHGLQGYDDGFAGLESLATAWIAQAFGELGWNPRPGEHVVAESLGGGSASCRVTAACSRGCCRSSPRTVCCARDAAAVAVLRTLPAKRRGSAVPLLLEQHPSSSTRFHLVATLRRARSTDILRGAADPLQRLFPGGSTELAESLYRDTPEAKAFNQLMRETLRSRSRRSLPGGGCACSKSAAAPAARPPGWRRRCRRRRPSTSSLTSGRLLVERAREKFAAHPFIDFQTLDLEQSRAGAGPRRTGASTSSSRRTSSTPPPTCGRRSAGCASCSHPGGMLLMLEVAGAERWIDITFGLTEGWWRFADAPSARRLSAAVAPRWLELLADAGFDAAAIGDARRALAARCCWQRASRRRSTVETLDAGAPLADRRRRRWRRRLRSQTELQRAGHRRSCAPADEADAALRARRRWAIADAEWRDPSRRARPAERRRT